MSVTVVCTLQFDPAGCCSLDSSAVFTLWLIGGNYFMFHKPLTKSLCDHLRVTAEVKHNPTNTIVCKAQGEWNGTLEFTYNSGETKVIDTTKLPVTRKKLRPVERQGRTESR